MARSFLPWAARPSRVAASLRSFFITSACIRYNQLVALFRYRSELLAIVESAFCGTSELLLNGVQPIQTTAFLIILLA